MLDSPAQYYICIKKDNRILMSGCCCLLPKIRVFIRRIIIFLLIVILWLNMINSVWQSSIILIRGCWQKAVQSAQGIFQLFKKMTGKDFCVLFLQGILNFGLFMASSNNLLEFSWVPIASHC